MFPPGKVLELTDDEYDHIIIAVNSQKLALNIKNNLLTLGAADKKIITLCGEVIDTPCFNREIITADDGDEILKIAIVSWGGLGDHLMATLLIKCAKKMLPDNLQIDLYVSLTRLFEVMPFIDNVRSPANFRPDNEYDVVMSGGNFFCIDKVSLEKVKRFSPLLYHYYEDMILHFDKVFSYRDSSSSARFLQYCRLLGKNRVEQCNIHGILPFDRYSPTYLQFPPQALSVLSDNGLTANSFITVCTVVNVDYKNSPKLYPVEYFDKLCEMIRRVYPGVLIVRIGESDEDGALNNVDLNLCGRTTLFELCALLKHSVLHIGCEGGLIHLKHFLNGKSCCIFGATVPEIYGYDENINFRSDEPKNCAFGCEHVNHDWTNSGCMLNFNSQYPPCTTALKPETVYAGISGFLDRLPKYSYRLSALIGEDEICRLFKPGADIALVCRRGENFLNACGDGGGSVTVYGDNPADMPLKARFEYGYVYNIPANDNKYDIVLNFTLQDEANPRYALGELLRITKPSGITAVWIYDSGKFGDTLEICGVSFKAFDCKTGLMLITKTLLTGD
ncbi:MAG: hypothetical protein LBJ14_03055 [Desulfarculales bacterium]|nr:hypothetical protein [Desulfarculales bacterium]